MRYCELDESSLEVQKDSAFPVLVTPYYASLIEKGNARDPLLLQVLSQSRESIVTQGYTLDPVGERDCMPVPGLIHKYFGRALLTLTGACAIHCRYCFRRHFAYAESSVDLGPNSGVLSYLRHHTEISEVILSGGDPLMWSNEKLGRLISQLKKLPHIKLLRIHSRILSVLPERITQELLHILEQFSGQIIFVTHINHAQEISCKNKQSFKTLSMQGHRLLNQSVLLKGINDNEDSLIDLSFKLIDSSIMPYYLHQLDKVQGAAHFDLPQHKVCELYKNIQLQLPGYLLPRLVKEIAGQNSKTTVHCG